MSRRWSAAGVLRGWGGAAAELVLPQECAGCGRPGTTGRFGVCGDCVATVSSAVPYDTRPDQPPPGMPPCAALAAYDGVVRQLVIAYKDRGRHPLARPLGRLLARPVAAVVASAGPGDGAGEVLPPVVLVPVPDTPAAARARHGDHLRRLASVAAAALRDAGAHATAARPLRARPRPDATTLDRSQRWHAAQASLRARRWRAAGLARFLARTGAVVVVVDDVVTSGATVAAAAAALRAAGVPVAGAAVLAATRRVHSSGSSGTPPVRSVAPGSPPQPDSAGAPGLGWTGAGR